MKNFLKIFLILVLFTGILAPKADASGNLLINNISIDNFINGSAEIRWRTSETSRGLVYFGEDRENLNYFVSSGSYQKYHRAYFNGLEEDKIYYYKIIAFTRDGDGSETFVQSFNTNDMIDTVKPDFTNAEILHTTGDTVSLSWSTNEETVAQIYYGDDLDEMNSVANYGAFHKDHELIIYHLAQGQRFYLKIIAKDRGNNTKSSDIFIFNTHGPNISNAVLELYDLEPLNFNEDLIQAKQVTVKFKSNLVSRSQIWYGTAPGAYTKLEQINQALRDTEHKITLKGLEPNTSYYYIIDLYDGLYGRAKRTQEYSFTTQPEQKPYVLGTKIVSDDIDSDGDGLSDNYEINIGTNPLERDSDGDGYSDGTEVRHGYDPNGPGKIIKLIYNKPRIANTVEQVKAIELKNLLESELGQLKLGREDWFTVVNAYIYGEYPAHAIAQSIRFGGKTVHPTIGWNAWKNTNDYQSYINR